VGTASVRYAEAKSKIDFESEVTHVAPLDGRTNAPNWDEASDMTGNELDGEPATPNLAKAWKSEYTTWLANNQKLDLLRSDRLKLTQKPAESERDFRTAIGQQLREARDGEVNDLRTKYASKIATLEDRIRKAQATKAKQAEQSHSAILGTVISVGGSILGAFLGGRKSSSVTKVITAGKAAGRAYGESQDVSRAEENIEAIQQQLATLQGQLEAEIQALQESYDPAKEQLETVTLRPKKTAIVVKGISVRSV
jgi:prefoldin subunit 5